MTIEIDGMQRTPDEVVPEVIGDLRETRASRETISFVPRFVRFVEGHLIYPAVDHAQKGLAELRKELARIKDQQSHSPRDEASNKPQFPV